MAKVDRSNRHAANTLCPCGSVAFAVDCCFPYIEGLSQASSAEQLMRSRYVAYATGHESYLLDTWHTSTRPSSLGLDTEAPTRWLGLDIKRHQIQDDDHAIVEFVARYKLGGRAYRLHETSRFVREGGRWFYIDGVIAG